MDIVQVGDRVKVKITQIDEKWKIQLTMKGL
jgi:predicted RNA-binding protein with RPS1 domain